MSACGDRLTSWGTARRAFGNSAAHNSPRNPNANDVNPPLHEIEQVRIKKRTDDVLRDNDEAYPFGQTTAAEQKQMSDPHRPQYNNTNKAKLYRHRQGLIVRICSGDA